jgi:hypothetical protein
MCAALSFLRRGFYDVVLYAFVVRCVVVLEQPLLTVLM